MAKLWLFVSDPQEKISKDDEKVIHSKLKGKTFTIEVEDGNLDTTDKIVKGEILKLPILEELKKAVPLLKKAKEFRFDKLPSVKTLGEVELSVETATADVSKCKLDFAAAGSSDPTKRKGYKPPKGGARGNGKKSEPEEEVSSGKEVSEAKAKMPEFKKRATPLKAKIDALKTSDPAKHSALAKQMTAGFGSAQAGDFETAMTVLDEIEAGLGAAVTATRASMTDFKNRANPLKAKIEKLKTSDPAKHSALAKQMTAGFGSAQAGDFETAMTVLDEIEAGLAEAVKTEAAAAKTEAAAAKTEAAKAKTTMNDFRTRAAAVKTSLEAIKTSDAATYGALSKKLTAGAGSAQAGDFETAMTVLDEIEAGLAAAVKVEAAAAKTEAAAAKAEAAKAKMTMNDFRTRAAAVKTSLEAIKTSDAATFGALTKKLTAGTGSAQAGDFETAMNVLDEIEAGLAAAQKAAAARPQETAASAPQPTTDFAKRFGQTAATYQPQFDQAVISKTLKALNAIDNNRDARKTESVSMAAIRELEAALAGGKKIAAETPTPAGKKAATNFVTEIDQLIKAIEKFKDDAKRARR